MINKSSNLGCWKSKKMIRVFSRQSLEVLIKETSYFVTLIFLQVSQQFLAVLEVQSFQVVKSKELQSREPFLDNQKSFFLMKQLQLLMRILKRRSKKHLTLPWREEPPSLLLIECPLLKDVIRSTFSKVVKFLKKETLKSSRIRKMVSLLKRIRMKLIQLNEHDIFK